jgi:hypothetical protein
MTRLSILVLVLSALSSTPAYPECAKQSSPGPFNTKCSCTGQNFPTSSCQYDPYGPGCDTVFPGNYCGGSGHQSCYVGYAEQVDCTDANRGTTNELILDPIEQSWVAPKVAIASCDQDPRSLADWLRTTPRFTDRQTKPN